LSIIASRLLAIDETDRPLRVAATSKSTPAYSRSTATSDRRNCALAEVTSDHWLIIDIETDGLADPIHVVELAGQVMLGSEPAGPPFRMLLNHNVPIPTEAVALHGYTQQYLSQNGSEPGEVYASFRDYAQDYAIAAHNLSYDWNRCLVPEWTRLGLSQIGRRGFCCMMLARRVVWESRSYRLNVLSSCFQLTARRNHSAADDVATLVELFEKVYRPRLERAGVNGFEAVADFARRIPVAKCMNLIREALGLALEGAKIKGEWSLDEANSVHARATMEILRRFLDTNCFTTTDVVSLNSWLQDAGPITHGPLCGVAHTVERILEDGVVTDQEKAGLASLIEQVLSAPSIKGNASITQISVRPQPIPSAALYTVVSLVQGSREWLEWRHAGVGASDASAVMGENPWKTASQLFSEKCLPCKDGDCPSPAAARGVALEPEARRSYVSETGIEVTPTCIESTGDSWVRASLDGMSADGTVILEIKCGDYVYEYTSGCGRVPSYYYAQLQHMMAITRLGSVDFWCYLPGRTGILVKVPRNDRYIERLLLIEADFWHKVVSRR